MHVMDGGRGLGVVCLIHRRAALNVLSFGNGADLMVQDVGKEGRMRVWSWKEAKGSRGVSLLVLVSVMIPVLPILTLVDTSAKSHSKHADVGPDNCFHHERPGNPC